MDDEHFMQQALRLARRGAGRVEPNPMVGCVIVRNGKVVGAGHHKAFGGPHAEANALADAGPRARGATAYITLEPCCHQGKTPPCANALIDAGIARAVVAVRDPNPQVAGRGLSKLRRAGIDVTLGPGAEAGTELIAPFAKRCDAGLPYVIAKWAQTIDGAIATRTGSSRWISGPGSRRLVHQLRARVDAIVVGAGTAVADDPMLNARDVAVRRVARRVVIDPNGRLGARSALVRSSDRYPVDVAAPTGAPNAQRLERAGVGCLPLGTKTNPHALRPMLAALAKRHDATNVLVEGGARTLAAFFEQGLVDEAWVFVGPKLVTDGQALRPMAGNKAVNTIARARDARLLESRRVGEDQFLRYAF